VGWQDRDWAKWDDRERAQFLGAAPAPARRRVAVATAEHRTELTLLAILVSVAGSVLVAHFHLYQRIAGQPRAAYAPVVYGTAVKDATGRTLTCTALARRPDGNAACTSATALHSGQRMVEAQPLPPGTRCSAIQAEQHSGRWVCSGP
jgi:hypothetical protein